MSAFMQANAHIDYLLTAGLWGRNVLRWYDEPIGFSIPDNAYREGDPWGPGAIDWHQKHSRELREDTADRVGSMLIAENRRSVNHRYAEEELEQIYTFRRTMMENDSAAVLQACGGYTYQSCEHPEWHRSEAKSFITALEHRMIRFVIDGADDVQKFWSLDDNDVVYNPGISVMDMIARRRDTN
jgi:hypothetical protein